MQYYISFMCTPQWLDIVEFSDRPNKSHTHLTAYTVIRILLTIFPRLYYISPCLLYNYQFVFLIPSAFSPLPPCPLLPGNCQNVPVSMSLFLFCLFIYFVFFIQLLIYIYLLPYCTHFLSFPSLSTSRRPFNISYNIGLAGMDSFSFFLSGKLFICPILNDSGILWGFGVFFRFYLFIFRERERNINVRLPLTHPLGGSGRNPATCPDWDSNRRPFGSQAGAQSTEPHQLQWQQHFLILLIPFCFIK